MKKQFIETGKIVGTHGIAGEMRVQPWADSPKAFTKIKELFLDENGSQPLKIISMRVHGNVVLLKADGVSSIEDAEKMRNKTLFASRDELLPKDKKRYLICDIIGCEVVDYEDESVVYGKITNAYSMPANDVWEIKPQNSDNTVLMPVIDDIVRSVDIDAQTVKITAMKGLFDEN